MGNFHISENDIEMFSLNFLAEAAGQMFSGVFIYEISKKPYEIPVPQLLSVIKFKASNLK